MLFFGHLIQIKRKYELRQLLLGQINYRPINCKISTSCDIKELRERRKKKQILQLHTLITSKNRLYSLLDLAKYKNLRYDWQVNLFKILNFILLFDQQKMSAPRN